MYRIHSGTPATAVRSGSRPAPPDSRYLADQKGSGRPLRYRIEAMKMNAGRCSQVAGRKKIHGLRPFRRGFHMGSPLERFRHSLASMMAGLYEQPATAFSRIQMRLRRYKLKLTTTLREALNA